MRSIECVEEGNYKDVRGIFLVERVLVVVPVISR